MNPRRAWIKARGRTPPRGSITTINNLRANDEINVPPTTSGGQFFLSLCDEIHMEIADYLADEDAVNVTLGCPWVSDPYVRLLRLRDMKGGPERLKSLLRFAYDAIPLSQFRGLVSMLPASAISPPCVEGKLLYFPFGDNTRLLSFNGYQVIQTQRLAGKHAFGGNGALNMAVARDDLEALRILLQRWDWSGDSAATPLKWAALYDRVDALRLLLHDMAQKLTVEECASLILNTGPRDAYSPLDCALWGTAGSTVAESAEQSLQQLLAAVAWCQDERMVTAKQRALSTLFTVVKEPECWKWVDLEQKLPRILDALSPLPMGDGQLIQILMFLDLTKSGSDERKRLQCFACAWMERVPPDELHRRWAQRAARPEIMKLVDRFYIDTRGGSFKTIFGR
ncbi:hypothetical protein FN846DRAFT_908684 [Sphaerosporella brunnea]|uniref:Ankyrin repeat-containing domain protein n=1 Tax=Sphaerosporella brunnea TaxID=1250544 RepID=A0A5J5ES61_9PEZI|nr:hypothetical protein FN846DRAFT_908684 [Sphaerosporella brunnea]